MMPGCDTREDMPLSHPLERIHRLTRGLPEADKRLIDQALIETGSEVDAVTGLLLRLSVHKGLSPEGLNHVKVVRMSMQTRLEMSGWKHFGHL